MLRKIFCFLLISGSASVFFGQNCNAEKGSATVQVLDIRNQPILGAVVTSSGLSGVTGNGGYIFSSSVPEGIYEISVSAEGFASSYHRIHVRRGDSTISIFRLLPVQQHYLNNISAKSEFQSGTVKIRIPAGAFDSTGFGNAQVASIEPGITDLRAMPGEFDGTMPNGENVALETLGALSLRILDQTGTEIQLRKPISIRFPYRGSGRPGDPVPLWSFDPEPGIWKQEGSGRIEREGSAKFVQAEIPHLSWWNLDQPISNKTSVWVKSFVTPEGSPLFTPILSGLGKDYTGISFPYDSYFKFQGSAPVLAGQCIDVKLGSKINLSAAFYNPVGSYEYEQEIQMPNRSSSCRTNPQDGVVINQLQMHRIASSCVRGRAAFRGAANEKFRVSLFATPQGDQVLWQWNRPLASAKTVSDGRFCVDHIPANRTFTFYFIQENPDISIEFPVKPLMAEECEGNARGARIEIKVPASQGFQCATDYDRCTDLGDIQGELQSTCGPG